MNKKTEQELNTFIAEWEETTTGSKATFLHFKNYLAKQNDVTLDFVSRPGVTYSLRAAHAAQKTRGLFVMVDVIEDSSRWLSICFYGDMISDRDERGDYVPEGLFGEDAVCFDLEQPDNEMIKYIEVLLSEACANAENT